MRVARVLFARIPQPGQVKTRLATELGPDASLAVYLWLLRVQARRFQEKPPEGHRFSDYVFYTPRYNRVWARYNFLPDLSGLSLRFCAQKEGDLGTRLAAAAEHVLRKNELVCFWGADIPALPRDIFAQAIALAPQSVITLARDGGYAFLSVAKQHFSPEIFAHIRWATHHTGHDQIRALKRAGVPVVVQGRVADLDRSTDFVRIIRELDALGYKEELEDLAQTFRTLSHNLKSFRPVAEILANS